MSAAYEILETSPYLVVRHLGVLWVRFADVMRNLGYTDSEVQDALLYAHQFAADAERIEDHHREPVIPGLVEVRSVKRILHHLRIVREAVWGFEYLTPDEQLQMQNNLSRDYGMRLLNPPKSIVRIAGDSA
jgi:hypothetical protein